jgi:hypothetical protein
MNPDELKLLELLKADEETGVIRFKHRRMLIFDANALGLLRKELVETLGLERARRILTRFGYANGYRDVLTSKELFHWQSDDDWFAAGPHPRVEYGTDQSQKRTPEVKPGRCDQIQDGQSLHLSSRSNWHAVCLYLFMEDRRGFPDLSEQSNW